MKKGFTLIELLVVVLIISILTAVALPKYLGTVDKAKVASQILPQLRAIKIAQEEYYLENGFYANTFADLPLDLSSGKCKLNDAKTTWSCSWGNFYMYDGKRSGACASHYKNVAFDVFFDRSTSTSLAGHFWCRPNGQGGAEFCKKYSLSSESSGRYLMY